MSKVAFNGTITHHGHRNYSRPLEPEQGEVAHGKSLLRAAEEGFGRSIGGTPTLDP